MKLLKKYILLALLIIWAVSVFVLEKAGIITLDTNLIERVLLFSNNRYSALIFLLLWVLRLIFLVPGVTFMVLGAVFFHPLAAFSLSMLGLLLSESVVYIIAKLTARTRFTNWVKNKYPDISPLIDIYNVKFLALGILCPAAPTDAVCFLSVSAGIKYLKFILTVFLANLPMTLFYSFIGISFTNSVYSFAFLILTVGLIMLYTIVIWRRLKNQYHME